MGEGLLRFGFERLSGIVSAEKEAERIATEAEARAQQRRKEADLEAQSFKLEAQKDLEEEARLRKSELEKIEQRLFSKEQGLDKKFETLEHREREFETREKAAEELLDKNRHLVEESRAALEKVAGMSSEEAKERIVKLVESDAQIEAGRRLRLIDEETRATADKKARQIITKAVERLAGEWVAEKTVTVVHLPNEEMKGRIIGKEGRNIRAIEQLTGIDLIIDDTPGAVILSGYNPVRREVAKVVLERLLQDGRIHPARIEEMVDKVTREIDVQIKEAGEAACFELGIHGIHPELIHLLGMLKYRTSYAQNVLVHSIEVGFLCGIMAAELGMNEKMARRAGLLHDIGKAVSHEVEGSHAIIGADFAKKYGEDPRIVHAVAAHHEDVPQTTALAHLVDAADALSGARPGARSEVLESYIKRVEDLERIAKSFEGVEKVYAIQAGRDVRVMVDHDKIGDAQAAMLSRNIARRIEEELTYPGQIRVMVIRESRSVDYAK
ncbi:MAG: ribonuclease Y [Deltaproteobacteria bacterium]|nr:ribonuclease Y [Deltaproteobacteria bacterium]